MRMFIFGVSIHIKSFRKNYPNIAYLLYLVVIRKETHVKKFVVEICSNFPYYLEGNGFMNNNSASVR